MSKKTAKVYGKVATLPKDTNPDNFMENIKIPRKNSLWYVLVEKQSLETENSELHMVKYNQEGVDANQFIAQIKEHYIKTMSDENIKKVFESIQVVGNDKFSIIKNVPDIMITEEVNGTLKKRKLLNKIASDLIRLLK